jgi:transposase
MGRSRGGLTTKIHALVDACGLPIALKLTEGQAHDGRSADDMLSTRDAGQVLLADRTIAMLCAKLSPSAAPGPTSGPCPDAKTFRPSAHSQIATETSSSAQQTQTLQGCRNPIRQKPRKLPRIRQTRISQKLDAI